MQKFKTIIIIFSLFCPSIIYSNDIQYSKEICIPWDYWNSKIPAKGKIFVDPVFNTKIKRLTDSNEVVQMNGERAIFSIDDKYFFMYIKQKDNKKALRIYNGLTCDLIKEITLPINNYQAVRWSYIPDTIIFPDKNKLLGINIFTEEITLIKEFGEIIVNETGNPGTPGDLCGGDGNDFDDSGEWIMLQMKSNYFAYNIKYDKFGTKKDLSEYNIDYVTISPSGNYIVLVTYDKGVFLWDKNWNFLRLAFPNDTHIEMGYYQGKYECVIGAVYTRDVKKWYDKYNFKKSDIVCVEFASGKIHKLLDGEKVQGFYSSTISGINKKYLYCAIASHGFDPKKEWYLYTGEILQVPLDGSQKIKRLCHHRCRTHDNSDHLPEDQPELWINHKGNVLLFRSNMGNYNIRGKHDLFLISIDN